MNSAASIRKLALGTLAIPSFCAMFVSAAQQAVAQRVTGTLGQADATTTINGKQIPEPPPKCFRTRTFLQMLAKGHISMSQETRPPTADPSGVSIVPAGPLRSPAEKHACVRTAVTPAV